MAWQTHREGRLAVGRVRGERAAARVHDLLCDIEAEAEIPGCRFLVMPCSPEGLEDERNTSSGMGFPWLLMSTTTSGPSGCAFTTTAVPGAACSTAFPAMLEMASAKRSGSQVPVTSPSTSSWMGASNSPRTCRHTSPRSVGQTTDGHGGSVGHERG